MSNERVNERGSRRKGNKIVAASCVVMVTLMVMSVMNRPSSDEWNDVFAEGIAEFGVAPRSVAFLRLESRWAFPTSWVLKATFSEPDGRLVSIERRRGAPFMPWRTAHFERRHPAEES